MTGACVNLVDATCDIFAVILVVLGRFTQALVEISVLINKTIFNCSVSMLCDIYMFTSTTSHT